MHISLDLVENISGGALPSTGSPKNKRYDLFSCGDSRSNEGGVVIKKSFIKY